MGVVSAYRKKAVSRIIRPFRTANRYQKMHNDISQTVRRDLLAANGLSPEDLSRSLSAIGTHHVDYADIYCQRTAFESWHLEEGMVKSGSSKSTRAWACARCRARKPPLLTPTA